MRALLVAASVGVLALTGCAPTLPPDAAWKACVTTRQAVLAAEHPDYNPLDVKDVADVAAAAGEACMDDWEADRAAFIERWG